MSDSFRPITMIFVNGERWVKMSDYMKDVFKEKPELPKYYDIATDQFLLVTQNKVDEWQYAIRAFAEFRMGVKNEEKKLSETIKEICLPKEEQK